MTPSQIQARKQAMQKPTFWLVYQAGLANVFRFNTDTQDKPFQRVLQSTFHDCELYCDALRREFQVSVRVAWCNVAGDVSLRLGEWKTVNFKDMPFFEHTNGIAMFQHAS